MRISAFIVSGISAALMASAQSIPACGANCLVTSGSASTCGATDLKCLCNSNDYLVAATACILASCQKPDQDTAYGYAQMLCNTVQVTIPPQNQLDQAAMALNSKNSSSSAAPSSSAASSQAASSSAAASSQAASSSAPATSSSAAISSSSSAVAAATSSSSAAAAAAATSAAPSASASSASIMKAMSITVCVAAFGVAAGLLLT